MRDMDFYRRWAEGMGGDEEAEMLALVEAYEQAVRERDKFKRAHEVAAAFANDKLIPRAVKAEQRADRLAAALRFYADGNSWSEKWEPKQHGTYGMPGVSDIAVTASLAAQDGGKTTRDALAADQEQT